MTSFLEMENQPKNYGGNATKRVMRWKNQFKNILIIICGCGGVNFLQKLYSAGANDEQRREEGQTNWKMLGEIIIKMN